MHRNDIDSFTTILAEWAEGSPAQLSAHQPPLPSLHAPVEIPIPSGTLRRRNNRFSGYDYSRSDISNDGRWIITSREEQNLSRSSDNETGTTLQPSPSCARAISWHREIGGITPSLPFAGRSNDQMTPQTQQPPSNSSSEGASDNYQQGNRSGFPSSEQFAPLLSSKRTKRKRRRSTI